MGGVEGKPYVGWGGGPWIPWLFLLSFIEV